MPGLKAVSGRRKICPSMPKEDHKSNVLFIAMRAEADRRCANGLCSGLEISAVLGIARLDL
jgi:hypothetical protein